LVEDANLDGGDCFAQAFGNVQRVLKIGLRQQHRKLLPAQAADDIGRAQFGFAGAGTRPQGVVPRAMAISVVDPLEVIDIHHQNRERLMGPLGPRDLLLTPNEKEAPVVHAGELIDGGKAHELPLHGNNPLTGADPRPQDAGIDWLGDEIIRPGIERFNQAILVVARRNQNKVGEMGAVFGAQEPA